MPLRRLELNNFKSYRGEQVIDFGEAPFTCIIGPNGSGKSNLMDAISFVLGVKSAQLRSTQLRDLVYRGRKAAEGAQELGLDVTIPETQEESLNGNDARTASVTAVYEDEEGSEWTFRRTISMSGTSTYYLNGKAVGWSAYNQQLEKFNILVKAKNFLVFQGDVEGVASQDSKALARLIDRISGSLELAPAYDAANLAQSKAAEIANSNSAAKRSMLTEAKHFKEQTAEVKQWEKLLAAKDALVQRHLLWRLYHLTNEINESTRQVESATEELKDLRSAVKQGDAEVKDARADYATTHLKVKSREAAVKKAEKAVDDKKPELLAVETQITHSEKKVKNTAALHERVEKDHARQAESLATLKAGAAELKKQMDKAKQRQLEKSQAAGKALSDEDLAEYRKLRSDANLLAVTERQQLASLRREQKVLRDALVSIDDRLQQAERKRAKLSQDVEGLADREETVSAKVKELDDERQRIKAQIDHAQEERTRISLRETELEDRLQETLQKLLQAGVDKRESEREVKMRETLSSLRRVIPGVHGRMSELIKPTASKYSYAVDIVLGRNKDAVIVDKESTAISCIDYMRQQRAGQATFIPLDTIQIKSVPEKLRNFARGARLAIDCVEFDASLERAVQHACGSAMICDNMDVAKYICYEKRQDVKAVTLDGTVIHKSGLIIGGSSGKKASHKFNDRDVDTLKQSKDKYIHNLQELKKTKPNPKDDEALMQSLARLEAEASMANDDLGATRLRLDGLRKELKTVEGEIKKSTPEREKRAAALAEAEGRGAELTATVDAADDEVFGAFCKRINVDNIRVYEGVQLKLAREESEALQGYTAQNARASHQIEFEQAQLQSTEERLALLESSLNNEKRNAERLLERKAEVEKEIARLQGEVEHQRAKLEKANNVLERCVEQVEETREAQRKAQRRLDRALKEISGWNDEIERSASDRHVIYRKCRLEDIDLPLVSGSLNNVPIDEAGQDDAMDVDEAENALQPKQTRDYGIEPDFSPLADEDRETSSDEHGRELESQIEKMKADAERLVPNMRAVDRLADVQAALATAEDEAEEARQSSKKAREEFLAIKKKRCELFNRAFKHMSGCIDRIYKDLTKNSVVPTGGMAFLSLENNEEPYLGGVKYNTMPPGKRFVEIEQLSGGEKTMAALALLFSIHSFHPAPFFVLDEVDAALDPTNVSKLARYVREQAELRVQFLIISLKSSLYEHADSLVGVYREQVENSSQTLSLDLRAYA